MKFYYKFFTNDIKTNEIYQTIKNNKDVGLEIANYEAYKENKILNIDNIIKSNQCHKIYHSQNKYFMIFNYYSEKDAKTYNKMKTNWEEYWDNEFEYSSSINTKKMVIHFLPQVLPGEENKQKGLLKDNYIFIEYLMNLSDKYNIKIYFENSFERNIAEFDLMVQYVKKHFNTDFGICYDIGHTNVWGTSENTLEEWIDYITNNKLDIHYHIHTNNGYGDEHQSLSLHKEAIEYKKHFEALKYLFKTQKVENLTLEVDNHSFINDYNYIKSLIK